MSVTLRPLVDTDLPSVVDIHLLAFPLSALTNLGHEAVRRYYDWQLTGPHDAIRVGAWSGNELIGFAFCGKFRGATSGFVKKNRVYLLAQVLSRPWLLFGKDFRSRIMVGLKALFSSSAPQAASSATPSFGILAIAVSPAAQGTGAGKLLMAEAERVARERGYGRMNLSVSTRNDQAIAFYEKLGWQKVLVSGEWRGQMMKVLAD